MKFNAYNTTEEVVVTKEVKKYCFEFTEEEAIALAKIHGKVPYIVLDNIEGAGKLSCAIYQKIKHLYNP